MPSFKALGVAALASLVSASPAPVPVVAGRDTLVAPRSINAKRTTASFDLARSWSGTTLFNGRYATPTGGSVGLHVVCSECYTNGTVGASVDLDEQLEPTLRLDFGGLEAYVELAVAVTDAATYTFNLFTSNTPLGMGLAGSSAGVIVAVDLVFAISAAIDIAAGGFYVTIPAGSYVSAGVQSGDIVASSFGGVSAKTLPITVTSGTATFQADLRLRTQAGLEANLVAAGADLVAGIYVNLIELVTIIETSAACGIQAREYLDLNVGAYARAGVDIGPQTFAFAPTVSTTLLALPTATQCLKSIASAVGAASVYSEATALASSVVSGAVVSVGASTSVATTLDLGRVQKRAFYGNASVPYPVPTTPTAPTATAPVRPTLLPSGHNATVPVPVMSATAPLTTAPATSTVVATKTYTVTSCKAAVVNCPVSLQTHITVVQTATETLCGGSTVVPAPSTTPATTATTTPAHTTATPTSLVPCVTPIVNTFSHSVPATTATPLVPAPSTSTATGTEATPIVIGTTAPATTTAAATTPAAATTAPATTAPATTAPATPATTPAAATTAPATPSTVVTAGAASAMLHRGLATAAALAAAALLI